MIYLISDPHGGENIRGIERYLEICTDADLLIILGDLCIKFEDTESNRSFTEWFLSLDKQIAVLDGNHENHEFINSFPNETWCGGEVHRLTDTIVHLKRGNVYNINGSTFFTMGGCKSSDRWKATGLWYDGEEPNEAELSLAYANLAKQNNTVDYVLTHIYTDYKNTQPDEFPRLTLEGLTKYIDENVTFKHWYSGHWHSAECVDACHTVVYDEPVEVFCGKSNTIEKDA